MPYGEKNFASLKSKISSPGAGCRICACTARGGKLRYIPVHAGTLTLIHEYLEAAGHSTTANAPLFRPVRNNVSGTLEEAITPDAVYRCVVLHYGKQVGIEGARFGAHALRATAATNALDNGADIAKVQEWLGHANVSTTRIYDRRKMRPEDSPTFKVAY